MVTALMLSHFGLESRKKIDEVEKKYKIVDIDKNFIPAHYIGKNCMGGDVHRCDELFLTLYCEEL